MPFAVSNNSNNFMDGKDTHDAIESRLTIHSEDNVYMYCVEGHQK